MPGTPDFVHHGGLLVIHAHHGYALPLLFERRDAHHAYPMPAGQVGDEGEHIFVAAHIESDAHPGS